MRPASRKQSEWIDGFLFLGNMPILDLLNTKPVLADGPTELLPDVPALKRWLVASGMAGSAKAKALVRGWQHPPQLAAFLKELIAFRERLREAVQRIESGAAPADAFLTEVNSRLADYPLPMSLRKREGKIIRETVFDPRKPTDFWAPIIHSAADLLSERERTRIRQCESCVLHFFDTSKKGSRRWCSMNICGNKIKVAAYQRRKRDQASSEM
jgi:predicted RNA-binding Zn ribbon-like protein